MLYLFDSLPTSASKRCDDLSLSPRSLFGKTSPLCPREVSGHTAIADAEAKHARHRGIRHRWKQAKQLSNSLSTEDISTLIQFHTGRTLSTDAHIKRIIVLGDIQKAFRKSGNFMGEQKARSAIWKEITILKGLKN